MERNLNSTNWGVRLNGLGYALAGNVLDTMARRWKYRAASFACGPVAYFNSLGDLAVWVRRIEETRLMLNAPERHAFGVEIGVYPIRPLWNPELVQSRTFAETHRDGAR